MEAESEFAVVADYWEPSEALFHRSVLEGHGIEAHVAGEYLGNVTGSLGMFGGGAQGGIRLMVHADDLDEAQSILANPEPEE